MWTDTEPIFTRADIYDAEQLYVAGAAGVVFVLCFSASLIQFLHRRSELQSKTVITGIAEQLLLPADHPVARAALPYKASAAWLQAFTFFSLCILLSWRTGVLSATFFHPLPRPVDTLEEKLFGASTFAVVLLGYWVIWPMGTVSYGRSKECSLTYSAVMCTLLGVIDGACEAQLFLVFWAVIEASFGWPRWGTALLTFLVQGGFKANWDQLYWNKYVAPEHNVPTWNKWKILFVHVPNVLVTFSFFVSYGVAWMYVASQAVALVGSTNAMKFPRFRSNYTNPPPDTWVKDFEDKPRADLWNGTEWETPAML
ncbi:hypothetical protein TeGR_g2294 [Tetraparma gracilis]|uniref:Uncharacterized protein n=1 Tax=Tetraparma gracilis TaxID=2962635 RepID=A0ABQ6N2C3_9STRA|nr:hypothetical protein TeGR_g2294 [Tetraparma gracilis]